MEVKIMKTNLKTKFLALVLAMVCLFSCISVSAVTSSEALQELATQLDTVGGQAVSISGVVEGHDEISKDFDYTNYEYKTSGGGSYLYSELTTGNPDTFIYEDRFEKLTAGGKQSFLEDMFRFANYCAECNYNSITTETVNDFMKILQNKTGMGANILASLLSNTKPDYATANKLYEPFSGVVGTILGVLAILIMALLGITMALDIAFITIPAVQLALGADGSGDGGKDSASKMSRIVSSEARQAVTAVNDSGGGNGQSGNDKMALGVYFKKRWKGLVLLGICLLYLVQGQIYSFVAWIINLMSGFLGF